MAFLILQEFTPTPTWSWGGSVGYLRVFASAPFFEATTGEYIGQGNTQDINSFCQTYTCTVADGLITIPAVTIATTVDSSNPVATFTAILYDNTNVPRYTLLSQFYVDPSFFQVTPQSSVLVTLPGSTSVAGVYDYRGQTGGYPYYNLENECTSTTLNVIKRSTNWNIYDGSGTDLYVNEGVAGNFPWENASYGVSGGIAPAPTVAEDTSLMVSTWENLTLSQGFAVIPITYPGPFWNVASTKAYVNSLIGDGTTPYAADLVAGKTQLDTAPTISTQPIAIGVNTPTTGTGAIVRQVSASLTTPNIGTPTFGILSACTGLPISTGVAGLGANMASFLATPSSSNLRATVTDESGTGALIFGTNPTISGATLTSPTMTGAVLNTPTSGNLSNCTNLPISTGVSGLGSNVASFLGTPSSANLRAALTDETGTGAAVFANTCTLVSPVLGTPTSGLLSNCTGLPVATGIANLGSGVAAFLANPTSGNLATAVTGETGSGALVFAVSPSLTTPSLGVSSAVSVTATGLIKSSGTAGIGYSTGAGGAVTQGTSRTTTVILNKTTGAITLFSAAGSATPFSFTVTNSTVIATDTIIVSQKSGTDKYGIYVSAVGAGSFEITVVDLNGSTVETPVINFCVLKGVAA